MVRVEAEEVGGELSEALSLHDPKRGGIEWDGLLLAALAVTHRRKTGKRGLGLGQHFKSWNRFKPFFTLRKLSFSAPP